MVLVLSKIDASIGDALSEVALTRFHCIYTNVAEVVDSSLTVSDSVLYDCDSAY